MHYTNSISDTIYDNVQTKKLADEKINTAYKKMLIEESELLKNDTGHPTDGSIFDMNNSDFILLTNSPNVMTAYDNMRYGRGSEVVC